MLIVAVIVAILTALIMKMLPEAVFFLFTFIPLRKMLVVIIQDIELHVQ